jgi:predicted DNA binding CopG/RHH family protein
MRIRCQATLQVNSDFIGCCKKVVFPESTPAPLSKNRSPLALYIRLSSADLKILKLKVVEEGMGYQTLITHFTKSNRLLIKTQ